MFPRLLFPFVLFAVASGWLWWHMRVWRVVQSQERDERELLFQSRRFRRRMQASGMLALLAVAISGGQHIDYRLHPSLFVFFWWGVTLLVFWMCALAAADGVSTHLHAARIRREQCVARAQLEAEVKRLQAAAENAARHGPADETQRRG